MIIRVSELPGDGLTIDWPAAQGSPYQDPAWRLCGGRVAVRRDGDGVVIDGEVAATVPQVCARCAEPVSVDVRVPIDSRFVPRPAVVDNRELFAVDLETEYYTDDRIDLDALLESETTLALPMRPLCRQDCRGLCPVCGENRNAVACTCAETPPDPRLAVLRELRTRPKP